MKQLYFVLMALCLCGCALHTGGHSFDGVSQYHAGDAQNLAGRAASELRARHIPAHTSLILERVPGAFGDNLEQSLRDQGFAVFMPGPDASGTMIRYTLDVLENTVPPLGYLQVNMSDGRFFSITQVLHTVPTLSPSAFENVPSIVEEVPLFAVEPPIASLPASASAVSTASPSVIFAPPTYRIHTTGTANAIAKRNRVPANAFCRWNNTTPDMLLHKGRMVYLHEPEGISQPAVTAVAVHPASYAPTAPVQASAPGSVASDAAAAVPASVSAPVPVPAPAVLPVTSVASVSEELAPTASETPNLPVELPAPALETWTIVPGNLHEQLNMWAKQADYQLIWKTQNDFDMESYARFQGDFLSVIRQLFAGLQRSGHALRVTLYQGNNVLEVNEE